LEILRDINLVVQEDEFLAILGPSGCGKSTLLRAIIGLEKPASGQILYRGQEQTGLNRCAALVFQSFALFPWLTVHQNIAVGLSNLALDEAGRELRIRRVMMRSAWRDSRKPILKNFPADEAARRFARASPWSRRCFAWTNRSARSTRSPVKPCATK
jgi:ABC-type nitrate/sulfonate/bicarbonate transport system ATPase subunit